MDIKVKLEGGLITNISYKDIESLKEIINTTDLFLEIEFRSAGELAFVRIKQGTEMEVIIDSMIFKYKNISKVRELYYLLKEGDKI